MRRIAIIGSGIAGLVAAHALRRAGLKVTLYSDRTAERWLTDSQPTGTAARFDLALQIERELGLDHWEDVAPKGEGVYLTFCPTLHNQLVRLKGRFAKPFQAVDLRLQCHRWMNDFDGELVIENVTVSRLDEIAAEHDLAIVAAGRAELSALFPRDDARSTYQAPQRRLAMVITTGGAMGFDGCPFLPVKFELLATDGEAFFVPYWHKDHGPTWNILFEAKPGSRMDRFNNATTGEEVLAIGKEVMAELFPWNSAWMAPMQLADRYGWVLGRVTPIVRRPVGRLPSGRLVTPLGDTAICFDPIAAQGANTAEKYAKHLTDAIVARGDAAFDETWMTETFDRFWDDTGKWADRFSNLLLEPITDPARELLIAQYGSDGQPGNDSPQQRIADAFVANFADPRLLTESFTDMQKARHFICQTTRSPWIVSAARGRAAIAASQLRRRVAGV